MSCVYRYCSKLHSNTYVLSFLFLSLSLSLSLPPSPCPLPSIPFPSFSLSLSLILLSLPPLPPSLFWSSSSPLLSPPLPQYLQGQFYLQQTYSEHIHWRRVRQIGHGGQAKCFCIEDCVNNYALCLKEVHGRESVLCHSTHYCFRQKVYNNNTNYPSIVLGKSKVENKIASSKKIIF